MLLFGCTHKNNKAAQQDTADSLKQEITAMQKNISSLQTQIISLQDDYLELRKEKAPIFFTPSSKGYHTISTRFGLFFVTLESLNKYANGYKATFLIGNPNYATFNDMMLDVRWGKSLSKDETIVNWLGSSNSDQITIDQSIYPGTWNTVTVVLSPAKDDDVGIIMLSLVPDQVSLKSETP